MKTIETINNKYQSVPMTVDPAESFFPQKHIVNSWFFIGRVNVEDRELAFLFHLMTGTIKSAGFINTVVSILDKNTGFYKSKDSVTKTISTAKIKDKKLNMNTEFAMMKGSFEEIIELKAELDDCALAVKVDPVGNVIYNGGTGFFPLLQNKQNYQYSCPEMKMEGSITIQGIEYKFKNGDCWFDRQWNSPDIKEAKNLKNWNPKWMWMGIKLDNGKSISLWEILSENGQHFSFITILHEDGHQTVSQVPSVVENADQCWHSDITNQNYPTHWVLNIPDFNARLEVLCEPAHQEIVSDAKTLNKYEAESKVTGVYNGNKVTGSCCVELLGSWK